MFPNYLYNLALSVLVPGEPAIAAIFFLVGWLHVAPEILFLPCNFPSPHPRPRQHRRSRHAFKLR
jgi:hypothetical protein